MIKFTCRFCKKYFEFEKPTKCAGHSRNCKDNPNLEVSRLRNQETQKRLGKVKHAEHVKKYTKPCLQCNDLFYGRSRLFCSRSCSATYHNLRKIYKINIKKIIKCIDCNDEIEVSNKCNPFITRCIKCKIEYNKQKQLGKIIVNICTICNKEFNHTTKIKTCSKECSKSLSSINRSAIILKLGTGNFKTKQEKFSYKQVENIACDSKLEKAAIIWLVDYFHADSIEKFRNILNFHENGVHRTFNPDFYVKKNNEIYIVEVKMKWIATSNHPYNRTIPLKRNALNEFCTRNNYNMIWLDFDHDISFQHIYKNLNKYTIVSEA